VEQQVSVEIAAPPDAVYDLIADVTRMGEWSPECVRCRWLDGAQEARPGARFRGTSCPSTPRSSACIPSATTAPKSTAPSPPPGGGPVGPRPPEG
jgi:uncharacterized protein YndB with AHSA1/START domain